MKYLVFRNGFNSIENSTKRPIDTLGVVPELLKDEDARWLQVEDIADIVTGNMVPTVTVNQALKDATISSDLSANSAEEAEKITDLATRDALLNSLLSFDENAMNDIAAIRSFAKDIKSYLLFKYRKEIKAKQVE